MGKRKTKPKISKVLIYQVLAKVLNRTLAGEDLGNIYHLAAPADGVFKPLVVISPDDPDIVKYVPETAVAADLIKYCETTLADHDDYQLTAREALACVDYWAMSTPPAKAPKAFAWPDEKGLAFTRLPWHPVADRIAPTWELILQRMSNAEAFKAWIGSLFDEQSYMQQYVWLHGKGNEGKGCINRFLMKVFGPAYCSKQPKERGDKFWTHELLGKRLVVFPDCNDQAFVTSGMFKSLTGGDPIPVEAKGEMSYTTRLNAKYLVFSNEKPCLSSELADRRRIIYCEIGARVTADDNLFEQRLWEEGGVFLGQCAKAYQKTIGGVIESDNEAIGDWIETVEMTHAEIFDFYFEKDPLDTDSQQRGLWVTPIALQRVLNLAYKSRKSQLDFLSWMEREKGIIKKTVRLTQANTTKLYARLIQKQFLTVVYGNRNVDRSVDGRVDR